MANPTRRQVEAMRKELHHTMRLERNLAHDSAVEDAYRIGIYHGLGIDQSIKKSTLALVLMPSGERKNPNV
jgi:hypothetical protein